MQPLMRLAHMNLQTCLGLGGEVTLVTLVCLVWLGDSRFGSHRLGSRLGCHGGECHWVIHCTLGISLYNFPGNERRQEFFMTQALESD